MNRKTLLLMLLSMTLLGAFAALAHDDDDDEEGERRPAKRAALALRSTPEWKTYEAECGSCHLAFPPHLLPAASWRALLSGLDDHFGQPATLDAATAKTLDTWLTQHAGPALPTPTLRITTTRWWVREHDELPRSVYARRAISTPANCGACHPRANEGAFGEHEVRIPRDAPAAR